MSDAASDPKSRHRRSVWPAPLPPDIAPPADLGHSHPLPKVLIRAVIALVVVALLEAAAIAVLAIYAVQDHNYILGKSELRDQENAALQEQIRSSICDLLDQLPEGGLLDRPRHKYGCGPGLPVGTP